MIDELRARYLPRFLEVAQRRIALALQAVTPAGPGAPQIARGELHTLAGEAGILGLADVAARAQAGEADCARWRDDDDVAARARVAVALRQLGAQVRALAAPPAAVAPVAAPPRIVVVDDSALVAEQVCDGLRADGCEASAASDVESTLRLVRELRPHVVLLDVNMPGLSLADLCAQTRAAAGATPIAICLLSGVPEAELTAHAHQVGADAYVSKTAGLGSVVARVRSLTPAAVRPTTIGLPEAS